MPVKFGNSRTRLDHQRFMDLVSDESNGIDARSSIKTMKERKDDGKMLLLFLSLDTIYYFYFSIIY
jgi:hypothetical protein